MACSEEAVELRESGIRKPILLLEGPFSAGEVELAVNRELDLLHSAPQLDWLLAADLAGPHVWIKVDTGCTARLRPRATRRCHRRLQASPNVGNITLMSHFARADETDAPATTQQLTRFLQSSGGIDAPRSLANSAAVLAWPTASRLDRPASCSTAAAAGQRSPGRSALRRAPRIAADRDPSARRRRTIGYGGRFTCEAPTRVGVVAIGYADGYPRHAPDDTPVAVNGTPTRLIGRVSMDMLTVDLNPVPDAQIGDTVQLWGDQVSAADVARHCDTIAYELFTRVSRRVHIVYR